MRDTGTLAIVWAAWVCTGALADTDYIKETLESVPESAAVASTEAVSILTGRLKDQKAVLLKNGFLSWDGLKTEGEVFVEYWMKPEGWDALATNAIELARLRMGAPYGRPELSSFGENAILRSVAHDAVMPK